MDCGVVVFSLGVLFFVILQNHLGLICVLVVGERAKLSVLDIAIYES